jgi:putative copper resistance protein D
VDVIAHGPIPPPFSPERLLTGWTLEPVPLGLIAVAAALYVLGARRSRPPWPASRTVAFLGGLGAALVAVASPVDGYATALFSVHMVQHVLLMFVAAPLLALGAPVTLALRVAGRSGRRRILLPVLRSRPLAIVAHPLTAFVLFTVVQYVTHLTGFYDAALENEAVHLAEHALYLGAALLFWWPVVGADPAPGRPSHPVRIALLVAAMPMESFLAVALLGAQPYPHYLSLPAPFGGAAAVADHDAAVAIMWGGGELAVVVGALLVASAWFHHEQSRQLRIEEDLDRAGAN